MNIENAKKLLEEEKLKIEEEMSAIGRRNTAVPNDWEAVPIEPEQEADIIDQADAVTERDTNSAIFRDLEARYDAIISALNKIDKGTYGICEICGSKIEDERLAVDPSATTCIACIGH